MKKLLFLLTATAFALHPASTALAAPPAASAELQTTSGQKIAGHISSVHGPVVVVASKNGRTITPLNTLDDTSLYQVIDFLSTQPSTPTLWANSTSTVANALKGKLQVLQDKKLVPLTLGDRQEPEFYLAYFSAHWCGPCRAFTPKLVAEYLRLKSLHPDRFELVFISSDETTSDQANYVREAHMPWPVVKLSAGGLKPLQQWHGRGIPDLVVTNRDGQLIFKGYDGDKYIGPAAVLSKFAKLLDDSSATNPTAKRAGYRLASLVHVRTSTDTIVPAKPYLIGLSPKNYQMLQTREFVATLKLDDKGHVIEVVATTPALESIPENQFKTDVARWLFLPAGENGHAKASTIDLPIKF